MDILHLPSGLSGRCENWHWPRPRSQLQIQSPRHLSHRVTGDHTWVVSSGSSWQTLHQSRHRQCLTRVRGEHWSPPGLMSHVSQARGHCWSAELYTGPEENQSGADWDQVIRVSTPGTLLRSRVTVCIIVLQVHQRQTERMRARSDWFLSDWPGADRRGGGVVTYRPVSSSSRVLSPRPTSLLATPSTVSSGDHGTSTPVHSSSGVTGKPPDGHGQGGGQVALRRKLSDKDKERRLVRRSSSKRKDKENGGSQERNGSQVSDQLNIINQSECICDVCV